MVSGLLLRWLRRLWLDLRHRLVRVRRRLLRELRCTLLLCASGVCLPGFGRSVLRLVLYILPPALQSAGCGLSAGWSRRAGDGTIDTGHARQRPGADFDIALAFSFTVARARSPMQVPRLTRDLFF